MTRKQENRKTTRKQEIRKTGKQANTVAVLAQVDVLAQVTNLVNSPYVFLFPLPVPLPLIKTKARQDMRSTVRITFVGGGETSHNIMAMYR